MDRLIIAPAILFIVISQMTSGYAIPTVSETKEQIANQTFFTKRPHDYPEKLIDRLLENTDSLFKQYFEPLVKRYGPEPMPRDECPSKTYMGPIYQIKDEEGRLRFVVQSEKFKQIVHTEQCVNPGPLKVGTMNLSQIQVKSNKLVCQQCVLHYKFLVLSVDRKSLETARIAGGLPVCCSCKMI